MIYIVSEKNDVTTDYMIEWMISRDIEYLRLKTDVFTSSTFSLSTQQNSVKLHGREITPKDVIIHRRGKINLIPKGIRQSQVYGYLNNESDSVIKSIEFFLKAENSYIGSYYSENQNLKLTNLYYAQEVGLDIPKTMVTGEKNELLRFFNSNEKIITKTIRFPVNIKLGKVSYLSSKTFLVEKKHIDCLSDHFAPILVQKYIEKIYEIRVFVFDSLIFPMAIFSQTNKKTEVDYRNYDADRPNRCVPVKLPTRVITQIKEFMKLSKMNSGSIDIIVTPKHEYIFLEINPQGQIDWVSKNCNYYIEKEIIELITKKSNGKN
jgi:hypothetical protein